jgi:hypothetical protein
MSRAFVSLSRSQHKYTEHPDESSGRGEVMQIRLQSCFLAAALVLTLSTASWGQWSSDPNQNLALSDIANADQVQAKVVPLADNGFFVSWFNSNPNDPPPVGYDTYLQRLNANGFEQFQHDGIQVAKLTNSSTEDYGLDVDTQGNALLTFLDTREGPNQQVTVTKISPSGQPLWGPNGIQVTSGDPEAHQPKVAATSDGGAVVFWISNSSIVLQKFDSNGNPQWPWSSITNHGIIISELKANLQTSDIHGSDNGSVIISFSRDKGFRTPRWLYANRVSASGRLLWGSGHVHVWDGGSLQLGNYPSFISDGAGGAIFAWYSSSPTLQSYVQHINADGTEAFTHNGVPVSTDASQIRVSPSAAYNPPTKEIFVSWEEEDSIQSVSGVYAQKVDANGNRQWTDNGVTIVPLQSNAEIFQRTVQTDNGAFVFWVDQQVNQSGTIQGVRLDNAGNLACAQFPVSSVQAQKSRPETAQAANGNTVIAFQDYRNGNSDIYVQNVNPDCTLGIQNRLHLTK